MAAAAGGQRASEVRRPMAVPLVDQQFKIPQNHPSKGEGQMGQYSSGRPITPAPILARHYKTTYYINVSTNAKSLRISAQLENRPW